AARSTTVRAARILSRASSESSAGAPPTATRQTSSIRRSSPVSVAVAITSASLASRLGQDQSVTDPVTAVPDELRTPLFAFVAPRAVFVGAAVALPIVGL